MTKRPERRRISIVVALAAVFAALLWFSWPTNEPPRDGAPLTRVTSEAATSAIASPIADVVGLDAPIVRAAADVDPTFSVLVVDAATREPLIDAAVEVAAVGSAVASPGPPLFRGATRNDGMCVVPLPRTRITLGAMRRGFATRSLRGIDPVAGDTVVVALVAETPSQVLVRDAATRRPIAGVRVFAQRASFSTVFRRNAKESRFVSWGVEPEAAVTGGDGIAELRGIDVGTWDFAVVAAGMTVAELRDVDVPFEPSPLVVDLEPGHELEVALVDDADEPQRDWRVQFRMPDRTWTVRTDDRGVARSPCLAAGAAVTVLVPRDDLDQAAMFIEGVLRPLQRDVVMPHPEQVRLVVSRARTNAFRVAWPKGSASDRLTIEVLQEMNSKGYGLSQRLIVTASEGVADVGAATSGNLGRFVVQAVGEESGVWRSEPFFVTGEGMTVTLSEVVPRSGVVRGRVLAADGTPVGGAATTFAATLEATGRLEPSFAPGKNVTVVATATSGGDGLFSRNGLLPGRHVVEARSGDRIGVATVDVGSDTALDLLLAPTGRIRGEVLHHDPRSNERLVVTCAERAWSRTIAADLDGRFVVAGLGAGSYTVALLPPPTFRPLNASGDGSGPAVRVDVAAGEDVACTVDAALVCRRLVVEVRGLGAIAAELQIERLHPYDRQGTQVWRLRRPVPRGGVVQLESLDPDADYVVGVRGDGRLLGWVEVPRGAERVVVRCDAATAVATITGVPERTELVLVPFAAASVARESLLRGERVGQDVEFRGVPAGAYRLVAGKHTDHCGPFTQSMLVQIGAGPLRLQWQPR